MDSWHCPTCDLTIKVSSRYGHLKSKKHLERLSITQPTPEPTSPKCTPPEPTPEPQPPTQDCSICLETLIKPNACESCHQTWCGNCDLNIYTCPYCRVAIKGREDGAQEQQRQIQNWYASSSAFDPTPIRRPRLMNLSVFEFLLLQRFNEFVNVQDF
jgi:hypothetical protein